MSVLGGSVLGTFPYIDGLYESFYLFGIVVGLKYHK